jgi:hypothetical protein
MHPIPNRHGGPWEVQPAGAAASSKRVAQRGFAVTKMVGQASASVGRALAHSARRGTVRSPESVTPRRAGLRCALSQWRACGGLQRNLQKNPGNRSLWSRLGKCPGISRHREVPKNCRCKQIFHPSQWPPHSGGVAVRTLLASLFPAPSALYDFIPLWDRAARAKVKPRDRANAHRKPGPRRAKEFSRPPRVTVLSDEPTP